MNNFLENRLKITRHNALFAKGQVTFRMGVNEYSDLSHGEFVSLFNVCKRSNSKNPSLKMSMVRFEMALLSLFSDLTKTSVCVHISKELTTQPFQNRSIGEKREL